MYILLGFYPAIVYIVCTMYSMHTYIHIYNVHMSVVYIHVYISLKYIDFYIKQMWSILFNVIEKVGKRNMTNQVVTQSINNCRSKSFSTNISNHMISRYTYIAAKGLHFSHPHRRTVIFPLGEISLFYLLVWLQMLETTIVILVRRTRSPSPLTN